MSNLIGLGSEDEQLRRLKGYSVSEVQEIRTLEKALHDRTQAGPTDDDLDTAQWLNAWREKAGIVWEAGAIDESSWLCDDCEKHAGPCFLVTDEIWAAAGFEPSQVACVFCVSRRLGRPLVLDDFDQEWADQFDILKAMR